MRFELVADWVVLIEVVPLFLLINVVLCSLFIILFLKIKISATNLDILEFYTII
jgi:hypothetical protein